MPYKRKGKIIYHKKGGKWKVKQRAKSIKSAIRAMRLLQGLEHGWKPTGKKPSYTKAHYTRRKKQGL
jgi:hypothetical protein